MNYQQRKAERTKQYLKNQLTMQTYCVACDGSGRYDHNGSPKCGACEGTGQETITIESARGSKPYWEDYIRQEQSQKWPDERYIAKYQKLLSKLENLEERARNQQT